MNFITRLLYRNWGLLLGLSLIAASVYLYYLPEQKIVLSQVLSAKSEDSYWFVLHRKSNVEFLYLGEPGVKDRSTFVRAFKVKSGVPGEKPTPLPELLGRDYWLITDKMENFDNPETAPYFLTLDIPISEEEPYGPVPYGECNGQCNWILPGAFGLHGVNGDSNRLLSLDSGSSGCIRHSDEDITYLYNILDPDSSDIRYYIRDI